MRTVLNILNFILGGFATTLGWLLATLVSIVLIFYAASHPLLLGDNKTLSPSLW
ncbi:inner membrane protein YccF [Klebsiella oxytoca]|nr:inner membrane protein YccF [Klebsiella oxytoca]